LVVIMDEPDKKTDEYPSLFDIFVLGDRVKRVRKDKDGKTSEYRGTVLAIDKNSIEIYWDTLDGKFRPTGIDITFTNCSVDEIFKGNDLFTPIEKD